MSDTYTLLDFIHELFSSVELRDYFAAEPEKALAEYGLSDLTPEDVQDALVLSDEADAYAELRAQDTADDEDHEDTGGDVAVDISDDQTGDFSRDYNTGTSVELPAHVTDHHVDDRDTIVDNSTNQQIDTGGGDFDQEVDVDSAVASGDGAVAAGGDINGSTIVSGNDNQVGDGNVSGNGNVVGNGNQAVTGDDNTTSFGEGDANSLDVDGHLSVGDGAAFATGGSATADNSDNSQDNVGNDYSDNSQHDVGNDYSDNSQENVGNDYSDNSDNSDNSQHDVGNVHAV
ncbi:MAG: IniB N-terminal domain-containing protein [Pseudonocardia sp.]|nr:IniB N-terminal domain-containing protein [Pseudonocardia sp.]